MTSPALAFPFELSYASRLTDSHGVPITGPIDVEVDFYTDATSSSRISVSPIVLRSVPLADGVLQINLSLPPSEFQQVFADSNAAVYVQLTDVTHNKIYQRQQFSKGNSSAPPPTL